MSDVRGASYFKCDVACSPTIFTMPEPARFALWMLARPLASPGPRCSNVDAGRCFMRYQPSAAPVATPSNRHSTLRRRGFSRAARKCISDVPGFAKQILTPSRTRVSTRLSAPFKRVLSCHPTALLLQSNRNQPRGALLIRVRRLIVTTLASPHRRSRHQQVLFAIQFIHGRRTGSYGT